MQNSLVSEREEHKAQARTKLLREYIMLSHNSLKINFAVDERQYSTRVVCTRVEGVVVPVVSETFTTSLNLCFHCILFIISF